MGSLERGGDLARHRWLSLAIAALFVTGIFAERHTGAFEPTHLENGRLVPGQFR
jgi:hypothetical protein